MKILTKVQEDFLKAFFKSPLGKSFFLTGGTVLAQFYLKHRKSEDLDFFTLDQKLAFDFVNAEILKIARALDYKIINQVSTGTYLQYIFKRNKETLKVDIVKDIPVQFGKVRKINNVIVDSIENIAVNKLLAIFGRTDAKDFVDFYFLLKSYKKLGFDDLYEKAKKKDVGLNEFYLASMLTEIENISDLPEMLKPVDHKDLKNFFLKLSEGLFKKIKPKNK